MSDLADNERAGDGNGMLAGMPETASVDAMSPGARLAAERQAHGLTIEQVASQLNLAPRQIVALESDNYAALPGMVIVRGFLRAYAKLLKIDPVPLLAILIDKNAQASAVPMRHALSASFSESRLPSLTGTGTRSKGLPIAAAVSALVVACVASYALGWWPESLTRKVAQLRSGSVSDGSAAADASTGLPVTDAVNLTLSQPGVPRSGSTVPGYGSGDDSGNVSNPVNAALPLQSSGVPSAPPAVVTPSGSAPLNVLPPPASAVPAVVVPLSKSVAPAAAAEPAATVNPLVLNVRDDSWIEIKRADNTAVIGRIIKGGSVETFDVSEPVTVTIGNIAGVEASLRGTPLDLSSAASGNVARLRLK